MQPVANSSFNVEADQLKTYIKEMNGRKPMAHIRSLPSLDKLIGGVVPGILTIVGAAPAAGKTTLLKVISDDLASQGVPTVFYSAELPAYRIAQKGITRLGNGDFSLSEATGAVPEKRKAFERACATYAETVAPNSCIMDGQTSMEDLCRCIGDCIHVRGQHPALFVDYLQLIEPVGRNKNDSMSTAVGEISRALKVLAKDLKVPVIALSQLNREVDKRPDKRPVLADLRESGAIEQDADTVMFLDRSLSEEEAADERHERPPLGTANVIVAKNRAGRSGVTVPLAFIADRTAFRNLALHEG